jgi:hypothetical protein
MAPRKRNKQDELNRTYRGVDAGRVGKSLKNQGYSQNTKGDTYYTVGGVKYDAATGKPVKTQAKPKTSGGPTQAALDKRQPASSNSGYSRPMPSAVTSGSSSSSNRPTPPASKPNVGPVADGESYARSKDPKKYNPLMQKTFGYQTGDAPDQRKASSTPANSGTKASEQTKENYSSSSITDSKVKPPADMSKSKTTNQTSTAFSTGSLNKKSESLAEQIRKRRMGR